MDKTAQYQSLILFSSLSFLYSLVYLQVGLEEMRQSFASLGIKLGLAEAKAMIAKQTGDNAGQLKQITFDYKDFLRSNGADIPRSDAFAERFATDADKSHIDIHNPVPQPSAAQMIVDRLRRERGPLVTPGTDYVVTVDEQTKLRPVGDATFTKSEIDKLGGLNAYLSEDNQTEAARDGFLPRLPGQAYAHKAIDDKLFRQGEFTNTVLNSSDGINAWNDDRNVAAAMPEGYHALPGQQPHRKIHDTLHFGGELKRLGGIGQYLDDIETERNAPEGYAYVFPGDAAPRRVNNDPMHAGGELSNRGGLLGFLADMKTDLEAEEGYLPMITGEQYAKKKQLDPLHHGGELLKSGIGNYIGEKPKLAEGYIQSITSMTAKKVNDTGLINTGSMEASTNNARMIGPSRPGQLSAIDDDDVPVLPEDVRVFASDVDTAFHRARAAVNNRDVNNLTGPASEIDNTGGLSGFLASNDPKVKDPVPITQVATRSVGHISKAGGLGGYIGKQIPMAAPEGYVAPLPGQDWARQKEKTPESVKGTLDRAGGLGAFLTRGLGGDSEIPEGYLVPLEGGLLPKKKGDLDKAMIGTLDKYGGLAGFYSNEPNKDLPSDGYLAPLPGQEFAHQITDTSVMRRGKLETEGLGNFMFHTQVVPEGFVAPLPGQNDDAPRQVLFGGQHNRGMLEKNGGLSGWLQKAAQVDSNMEGYVLYPGEAARRGATDPLHHYSTIGSERGNAFSLDIIKSKSIADDDLQHNREAHMVGGKLITATSQKDLDIEHVREAHLRNSRIVETTHDQAEISQHVREERISAGIIGARRSDAALAEVVNPRETSLKQLEIERKEEAKRLREIAEQEVMERAGLSISDYITDGAEQLTSNIRVTSLAAQAREKQAEQAVASLATQARERHIEQANEVLNRMSSGPRTHTGAMSPNGYAVRHRIGAASPKLVTAVANNTSLSMDVRRLARVRKAIRDVLPKKGSAAAALLRQRLHKEDGDGDGVVSDVELLRGLTALNPGLTGSDVGFIVRYMRDKAKHVDDSLLPEGYTARDGNTSGGLGAGIDLDAVAEWVTRQPGGLEGKYSKEDGGEDGTDAQVLPSPVVVQDRITWNSRAQKFVAFRAHWEERHGLAAQKEIANDIAQGSEGPTWTRADPQPFKVLHLAGGPPSLSK